MANIIERKDRTEPARNAAAVTPNDSTDLTNSSRNIYVGTSGNLTVTMLDMADGTSVTLPNAPVGYHPLEVKRIWSTGTTASNIVVIW
jgi:hypothetical protein